MGEAHVSLVAPGQLASHFESSALSEVGGREVPQ